MSESTTGNEVAAPRSDGRETRDEDLEELRYSWSLGKSRWRMRGTWGDEEVEVKLRRWERASVKLEFGEEWVEDEGYVGDDEDVEEQG